MNITQGDGQSGGNMSDKEVRFGQAATANWTVATSDASNGSVNGGFDAMTPAGGAVPLVNLFLGEVIFGGVGSGLYGMFFYIVLAVFVAGLMVGRTPEWLGKKIEAREIKYAAVGALFVPTMVLVMTAVAVSTNVGLASIFNQGVHGFTESLYAYDSQSNNNGSAFAGYGLTNFSAEFGTVALYLGRLVPAHRRARARAARSAQKKIVPASAGTFRTDGPTFVVLLVGVIALTAGLMIFPALDARADRRGADALMRSLVSSVDRGRRPHRRLRLRLPAAHDRVRAGRVPGQGEREPDHARTARSSARSLAGQEFTSPRYFHGRPSATSPAYNAGGTTFANLGPTNPDLAKNVQQAAAARS